MSEKSISEYIPNAIKEITKAVGIEGTAAIILAIIAVFGPGFCTSYLGLDVTAGTVDSMVMLIIAFSALPASKLELFKTIRADLQKLCDDLIAATDKNATGVTYFNALFIIAVIALVGIAAYWVWQYYGASILSMITASGLLLIGYIRSYMVKLKAAKTSTGTVTIPASTTVVVDAKPRFPEWMGISYLVDALGDIAIIDLQAFKAAYGKAKQEIVPSIPTARMMPLYNSSTPERTLNNYIAWFRPADGFIVTVKDLFPVPVYSKANLYFEISNAAHPLQELINIYGDPAKTVLFEYAHVIDTPGKDEYADWLKGQSLSAERDIAWELINAGKFPTQ